MRKNFPCFLFGLFLVVSTFSHAAKPKPFKRALVIAGGGMVPGIALGMIAAAKKQGWNPDLVISTCGSSIPVAIANSYPRTKDNMEFAMGDKLHQVFTNLRFRISGLISLYKMIQSLKKNEGPFNFFEDYVIELPVHQRFLPESEFRTDGPTKFIIVAAKALFSKGDLEKSNFKPKFRLSYFTDSKTAQYIQQKTPYVKKLFPNSYLDHRIEVIDDARPEEAARASISDPILLNPSFFRGNHYITGAADLYPVETALELAEDVMVTYPGGLFDTMESIVIEKSMGFNINQRLLSAIQHKNIRWVDMHGIGRVDFDPSLNYLTLALKNKIPRSLPAFRWGVYQQYQFGYERTLETLSLPHSERHSRKHIRKALHKD